LALVALIGVTAYGLTMRARGSKYAGDDAFLLGIWLIPAALFWFLVIPFGLVAAVVYGIARGIATIALRFNKPEPPPDPLVLEALRQLDRDIPNPLTSTNQP